MSDRKLQIAAWGLTLIAVLVSVVAWGGMYNWNVEALTAYQWFPLFGLLAFSLMWSHYIVAAVRLRWGLDKSVVKSYFEVTSLMALVAILLHPALLGWQLWRDGLGLPPESYRLFVGQALYGWVIAGLMSLLMFIAFEFRRKFENHSWWQYIRYLSDAAMFVIFFHGLKLGSHLQSGWFRYVWYLYGITLVASLIMIYWRRHKAQLDLN